MVVLLGQQVQAHLQKNWKRVKMRMRARKTTAREAVEVAAFMFCGV